MIAYRPNAALRIGDAERDSAIQLLSRHFADGRLTQVEHEERMNLALRAKTAGELDALFADLPRLDSAVTPRRGPRFDVVAAALPSLCLLCLVLAVSLAAAHLVPIFAVFLVFVFLSRGFRHRRRAYHAPPWAGRRW